MYKAFIRFSHGRCVLRGVGILGQGFGIRDWGLVIRNSEAGGGVERRSASA
jgi:hypothetical protein